MQNVRELIESRAAEMGGKVYLVFKDQEITYAQVNRRVDRVAAGLAALGVSQGARVALLVRNSPEFIYLWWALLKLGAVMVPVNLRLTAKEAAYVLGHCRARAVAVGSQSLELLPRLKEDCPEVRAWLGVDAEAEGLIPWREIDSAAAPPPRPSLGLDDRAVILYTSGTTGFPKGVVHTHGDYLRTAASFARTAELGPSDRLITANPLFHVNAQFYSALGCLWAGATLILAEKFSASRWWDWTRRYQANKAVLLLALTTILWGREPRPDDADNPLTQVVAGGAPKGHYRDFEQRFGVRLQTLYSLTEAPLAVMGARGAPCIEGAVGVPMEPAWPGDYNRVKVFDDEDREAPPGTPGQIVIQNPAVMKEYLDDPEATAEALKGGWLHTGDRGVMDPEGVLYFLGRAKDVIRKKGENISAVEVETVLAAAPGVAEAAVIGVTPPDAVGEEEILALVVWAPGAGQDWQALIEHCARELADFKVPRFWRSLAALPKNAMNRVVKERLRGESPPEQEPGTFDCQTGSTR